MKGGGCHRGEEMHGRTHDKNLMWREVQDTELGRRGQKREGIEAQNALIDKECQT